MPFQSCIDGRHVCVFLWTVNHYYLKQRKPKRKGKNVIWKTQLPAGSWKTQAAKSKKLSNLSNRVYSVENNYIWLHVKHTKTNVWGNQLLELKSVWQDNLTWTWVITGDSHLTLNGQQQKKWLISVFWLWHFKYVMLHLKRHTIFKDRPAPIKRPVI